MAAEHRNFMGAKLALFLGSRLLCLHRDDRPGLLWPGHWDLAGGGREGGETPLACALRETREEFALVVPPSHVGWGRAYTNSIGRTVWFFVGHMPHDAESRVRLGGEGQGWALRSAEDFIACDKTVPQFKPRLADYLSGVHPDPFGTSPY